MHPEMSYVVSHVHVDGPIPGPHSLLTVTAAAHTADGEPLGTFTAKVRELPGACLHPDAVAQWRPRADDWLSSRRRCRPPAVVMQELAGWVSDLPGGTVFVTEPDDCDHLFLCWYLHRFARRWPFVRTLYLTAPEGRAAATADCPLRGCRNPRPSSEIPRTS